MSYSYIKDTARLIQAGWLALSGTDFGSVTFDAHSSALGIVAKSEDSILHGEAQLAGQRSTRDDQLLALGDLNRRFYYGVMCHPGHGEDSPFLSQCGYTRRSDRNSPSHSETQSPSGS